MLQYSSAVNPPPSPQSRDFTQTHVDAVPIFRLRINEVLLRRLQHSRCAILCASLMGHRSGILFLSLLRYGHSSKSLPVFMGFPCSLSLAGAATTEYHFCHNENLVATKHLSLQQKYVCHDKHNFVTTKPHTFVATNICLS